MFCTRSHDQQNALMFFDSFTWTAECYDSEETASRKKMIRRTWRCMFCTNDVGVSSVSSPYRVQIVSRCMKKSWYLTNSRSYNIHRALKNIKADEHDQPFLLSGCNAETRDQRGLKGLSVSQFLSHSPAIWLGHMATRTRFEVPFWRKYGGRRFLKHLQKINGLQNAKWRSKLCCCQSPWEVEGFFLQFRLHKAQWPNGSGFGAFWWFIGPMGSFGTATFRVIDLID